MSNLKGGKAPRKVYMILQEDGTPALYHGPTLEPQTIAPGIGASQKMYVADTLEWREVRVSFSDPADEEAV